MVSVHLAVFNAHHQCALPPSWSLVVSVNPLGPSSSPVAASTGTDRPKNRYKPPARAHHVDDSLSLSFSAVLCAACVLVLYALSA